MIATSLHAFFAVEHATAHGAPPPFGQVIFACKAPSVPVESTMNERELAAPATTVNSLHVFEEPPVHSTVHVDPAAHTYVVL